MLVTLTAKQTAEKLSRELGYLVSTKEIISTLIKLAKAWERAEKN